MKTQPNDVIPGGRYETEGHPPVIVTAVKPKGRGFYVVYQWHSGDGFVTYEGRAKLQDFRKTYNINQRAAA
jgi:hypothetical protein